MLANMLLLHQKHPTPTQVKLRASLSDLFICAICLYACVHVYMHVCMYICMCARSVCMYGTTQYTVTRSAAHTQYIVHIQLTTQVAHCIYICVLHYARVCPGHSQLFNVARLGDLGTRLQATLRATFRSGSPHIMYYIPLVINLLIAVAADLQCPIIVQL